MLTNQSRGAAKDVKLDNLYSVIYVGDSNVTVGKPFRIQCLSKVPIEWHKDGRPIQEHFVRHSKDEFNYEQHDVSKDNDMIESTLSVNHALLRHSGKYKCNIHHQNSHVLYVNENAEMIEVSVFEKDDDDDEDDHLEVRVSFEPPVVEDELIKSTMMIFVEETEPNRINLDMEEEIDYDEMSSETSVEEKTTLSSIMSSTVIPSTTSSIPLLKHPKHFEKSPLTSTIEPTNEPSTTTITQEPPMIKSKGSHDSHRD